MGGVSPTTSAPSSDGRGLDPFVWAHATRDAEREARWLSQLAAAGLPTRAAEMDACAGLAVGIEPTTGDPNVLAVLSHRGAEPYWVDRRSMRVVRTPALARAGEQDEVVQAADLADRVQLCLGEPVAVGYVHHERKLAVGLVRPVRARVRFTNASRRRIAPFVGDRSTLAPLSIDALDRALRLAGERGDAPTVRRIFARAYRRIGDRHTPWGERPRAAAATAATHVVRLGRAVSSVLAEADRYRARLSAATSDYEVADLTSLDTQDLLDLLRACMGIVTDALVLLERARFATLSLLPGLERLCGTVPRHAFAALAAPQATAERAAVDAKLVALAERCLQDDGSQLQLPPAETSEAVADWLRLRRTLRQVRVMGMDVRPEAMGSDDAALAGAVREAWERHQQAPERARHDAERSLVRTTISGWGGPLRVGPLAVLLGLLRRLARAKGVFAEGLASSLLHLRRAAVEAGRRLVDEGVFEQPDDALYLELCELEQALEGEVGAYGSRVCMRREDDLRWRHFDAPRVIPGRRV